MKRWTIVGGICLCLFIAIAIGVNVKKNTLYDQNAAKRWSEDEEFSQMSIIYQLNDGEKNDFTFLELSHSIQNELDKTAYSGGENSGTSATGAGISKAVAVANSTVANNDISFPSSVSVTGTITLSSESSHVDAKCIGVKNDYFTIHPMPLLYGNFLTKDDMMNDGVIIDEDIAWKLFGSSDVAGLNVTIGGVPHVIRGVVEKPNDRIAKAAGLEEPICFVDLSTLTSYGKITGSYVYEVIIPNPVDGFAMKIMRDALGEKKLEAVELIENSTRFDNDKLWGVVKQFGIRSMTGRDFVYPYYENTARAWEDILAALLLIQGILLSIPLVVCIVWGIKFFKSETYKKIRDSWRHIWEKLKESLELHSPV